MIIIGLTGSIGMGKSTTSAMFKGLGIPVNDSDAVVHDLYRTDAVSPVGEAFPGSVRDGAIDRAELSRQLAARPDDLKLLEKIVHPLVRQRENLFIETQKAAGKDIVTCDPETQRKRVLARPGMTEEKFRLILARQMPDAEKRKRADFLIDTSFGLEAANSRVEQIVKLLRSGIRSETNA